MFAVVAAKGNGIAVYYVKEGFHRFIVGDALGVVATHNVDNVVGEAHVVLADDIIVSYFVHLGLRSNERNAVEGFLVEE